MSVLAKFSTQKSFRTSPVARDLVRGNAQHRGRLFSSYSQTNSLRYCGSPILCMSSAKRGSERRLSHCGSTLSQAILNACSS